MKHFLLNSDNIERDSYIWNMLGSLLMAFQSVIMLMILTRTVGIVGAGIFTIAYANANLFLNIGKYGMRYYQVSDIRNQYSFIEYRNSRWITCALMMLCSLGYVMYASKTNHYSSNKTLIIIWMCLLKLVDGIEDIYHGFYQQKGRLDVAAKGLTIRMGVTIVTYGACLMFLKNQLYSLIITTIVTTIIFVVFLGYTYPFFRDGNRVFQLKKVKELLLTCFPLFVGAFLSFYIGNAPKYAIDSQLSDQLQACYGFISMPVFVIGLLNTFIFNPVLFRMSCEWKERKINKFLKRVTFQIGVVFVITIVCLVGAYFLGVPVLSALYNTDLSLYKSELLILLVGGGLLGLSGLLNALITIIRYQKMIIWGYLIVAILAFALSNCVVGEYGMMGAAVLYMILMAILSFFFIVLFATGIFIELKRGKTE